MEFARYYHAEIFHSVINCSSFAATSNQTVVSPTAAFCPQSELNDPRGRHSCSAKYDKQVLGITNSSRKDSKRRLSHILRTEVAILGVEKKSFTSNSKRLWPKAVLEALDEAIANDRWESALRIFDLLRRQHWYHPKSRTYARLLTMLGRCGRPVHASSLYQTLLSEGVKPTVDVYTSLLGAFGHNGLLNEAFYTLEEMKSVSDCKPDVYTYTVMLKCCFKSHRIDLIPKLLAEMSYFGIRCSVFTHNTIIDGYGKAGMVKEMDNHVSEMLETGTCVPDVITMNSVISVHGIDGQLDKMEKWYDEFQGMGIEPDVRTFNILMRSYGKACMFEKMTSIMEFMKKRYYSPTTVTYNIILETFGKAGNTKKMESYFRLMKFQGVKPNSVTYCSVINAYSMSGSVDKISAILREIENSSVPLDTPFFNCVINAYGQAGELETMEEMFLMMKERKCRPDTATFGTMVRAYTSAGMMETARKMESKMAKLISTNSDQG